MKDTEKYIAPDFEFVSFDVEDDVAIDVGISSIEENSTRDAIIDWS